MNEYLDAAHTKCSIAEFEPAKMAQFFYTSKMSKGPIINCGFGVTSHVTIHPTVQDTIVSERPIFNTYHVIRNSRPIGWSTAPIWLSIGYWEPQLLTTAHWVVESLASFRQPFGK
jgi:hypothetical protein